MSPFINKSQFVLLALAVLTIACKPKQVEQAEDKPQQYCLSDTLLRNLKVDTARILPVLEELTLSGKITYDEDKKVKVYPLVGGQVADMKVELGDYVTKGQVLAVIRSGEIADYENQLSQAKSALTTSRKNLDVAEDLFKSGLSSERDVVSARKDYSNAQADLRRIQEVMRIYGVGSNSVFTVKAPITGFVVEKNITENMQFQVSDVGSIFTISDLNEVWNLANVYESDIDKVKPGIKVSIQTVAYPGEKFHGIIDKVFNALDPESRVMRVRVKLNNKDFRLKPDMFTTTTVAYNQSDKALKLPVRDVIFDKNKTFVLVYKGKCNIQLREVQVLKQVGDYTYFSAGLDPGELILASDKMLVYGAMGN